MTLVRQKSRNLEYIKQIIKKLLNLGSQNKLTLKIVTCPRLQTVLLYTKKDTSIHKDYETKIIDYCFFVNADQIWNSSIC